MLDGTDAFGIIGPKSGGSKNGQRHRRATSTEGLSLTCLRSTVSLGWIPLPL
jgi:hypothetical protein